MTHPRLSPDPLIKQEAPRGPVSWEALSPTTQEAFLAGGMVLEHQFIADNRNPFSNTSNIPQGLVDALSERGGRVVWPEEAVDEWVRKARNRDEDVGPAVYPRSAFQFYEAFGRFPIEGKSVLVMGSVSPWVEAIALAFDAREVVTSDYQPPLCEHPSIQTLGAQEQLNDPREFDILVSYSSIEHDGLGRYGDPIRPDGDLVTLQQCRRFVKEDGVFFLAVPVGDHPRLVWNHHRIYGVDRFRQLIEGWELLDFEPWLRPVQRFSECFEQCTWQNQPICVLRKKARA